MYALDSRKQLGFGGKGGSGVDQTKDKWWLDQRMLLARELWDRANANGWQFGKSVLNGVAPFSSSCVESCICLRGEASCPPSEVVCLATALYDERTIAKGPDRMAPKQVQVKATNDKAVDLSNSLRLACPVCSSDVRKIGKNERKMAPWTLGNAIYLQEARLSLPVFLTGSNSLARESFWAGCGTTKDNGTVVPASSCTRSEFYFSAHASEFNMKNFGPDIFKGRVNGTAFMSMNQDHKHREGLCVMKSICGGKCVVNKKPVECDGNKVSPWGTPW